MTMRIPGDSRPFDQDELRRMHENASTESIVNHAAREAHVLKGTVSLHGNDATRKELAKQQRSVVPSKGRAEEVVDLASTSADALELAGVVEMPLAPSVLAPIVSLIVGFRSSIQRPAEEGGAQNLAVKREQMHVALTAVLDLPAGYKDSQNGAHAEIPRGFQSDVMRLCEEIHAEKGTLAVLQLHCDEGMNAARMMIDSYDDQGRFFRAHPELAERHLNDAAFRKGFDALTWAKDHGQLAEALHGLYTRDARYDAAHIAYFG